MSQRTTFLATVRARFDDEPTTNPLRPIGTATGSPISYSVGLSDPVDTFIRAATAAGAEVLDARGADEDAGLVALVEGLPGRRMVRSAEPECDATAETLLTAGFKLVSGDAVTAAGTDLGLTGAVAGVALTGSLVVASQLAGSRLASLLPPVHVAVLEESRIVSTPGDVFRGWSTARLEELGSNVVFITGPSRSADIELQLTIGVHGPGRLIIVLTG